MTDLAPEESAYRAYMDERQAAHGARFALGPSAASKCYRQAAFEYLDIEPSEPPESKARNTNAADLGTLLHLGWSAMIRSRFSPERRQADVPLHAEGMPRGGEADDVDYRERIVRDVKSTKDRVFDMWLREGPYESHWEQLEVYALALRQQYGGDWTLCVVAINRETGQVEEFMRPADPEVGRAIVARIADMHLTLTRAAIRASDDDALSIVEEFPREGKGPGRGMPCDWCPFLSACWPDPTGPDGTPQSATMDPDDMEAISSLASQYLTASAIAKKAYDQRDDIKPFLSGMDVVVPDPEDPEYELTVKMVGGNPGKPEYDCEAMAERLESLGYAPIMRETTTARYVRIGRRKAKKGGKK